MLRDVIPHTATALAQTLVDGGLVDCADFDIDDLALEIAGPLVAGESMAKDVVTGASPNAVLVEAIALAVTRSRVARLTGADDQLREVIVQVLPVFQRIDAPNHERISKALTALELGTKAYSLAYASAAAQSP